MPRHNTRHGGRQDDALRAAPRRATGDYRTLREGYGEAGNRRAGRGRRPRRTPPSPPVPGRGYWAQ
ncbi:hypothetical protein GCM10009536_08330 [Streptomyces thermocarboxydus]